MITGKTLGKKGARWAATDADRRRKRIGPEKFPPARSVKGPADERTNRGLPILGFQLRDVRQKFLFIRQAREEMADHLVRPKRRLAARPQADQHAGDDRAIRLDLNPIG